MGGNVKLSHRFVPGTFKEVSDWLTSKNALVNERMNVAPNTSVRLNKISGKRAITYEFYLTDILSLLSDGSIIVNTLNTSTTTFRRLNQFLRPLSCYVNKVKFLPYLSHKDKHIALSNDSDRIKLDA